MSRFDGTCALAALATLTVLASDALADEALPWFASKRPIMKDAADKSEGVFVTAVPLFNYDSSTGFGIGAGGYLYFNGPKTAPLFSYTPYAQRFFLQVFGTTGGYQQHQIAYDALYLGGTPFGVHIGVAFERNTNANYFGVGTKSLGPPTFGNRPFTTLAAETDAASALVGDVASPKYNEYEATMPSLKAVMTADLAGGILRLTYGALLQHVGVALYDRSPLPANGPKGTVAPHEGPTLLGTDCAKPHFIGCAGGWNNRLKLAVALDTRDFEPDPSSGVFVDATMEWSARAFGSAEDYLRGTLAGRFFWSPAPKHVDLVFAARLLYSVATSQVPFFAMNNLAQSDQEQEGLGGENTLRGFRQDRFVGRAAALANLEVRWRFWKFVIAKQRFSLQVAPFFDVGRVFDKLDFQFTHFQPDGGGGLRLAWNQSTLLRFDAGFSREDYGLFVDFGLPF